MRVRLLALTLLAAGAAAAGCQTGAKPLNLNERAEYAALKKKVPGKVQVRLGVDVLDGGVASGRVSDTVWRVTPDRARIGKTLRRFIKDLGVVQDVAEGRDGANLVLEVRPRDAKVAYKGFNNYVYGNAVLLFFGGALAWWVPDETWTASLGWEVALLDKDGRELASAPIDVDHQQELADFDRGWDFMSAMFLWGFNPDSASFSTAGGLLMPQAEADATLLVCQQLAAGPLRDALVAVGGEPLVPVEPEKPPVEPEKPPVEPEKPPVEPEKPPVEPERPPTVTPARQPVRRAIVMGVELDAASVQPDTVAVIDAGKAASLLQDAPLRIPREGLELLTGSDATADRLKAALAKLTALQLTADDVVVFFFAGRGTVLAGGKPAVVCDNGDPTSGQSCVTLEAIRTALQPAKLVCFIDAAFDGWAETRGPGATVPEIKLPAGWATASDTAIFVAARSGSAEVQYVDDPAGAFETGVFAGGVRPLLQGGGDRNADGILTVSEASQFLAKHVETNRGATTQADPARLAGVPEAKLWNVR